jgi:hypothetical protein
MYEADRIPKNGKAPAAMGGFAFVQVGDAADYIRKALGEHVVTMMPTAVRIINQADRATKAGGSMTTVDIVTDWTLTDGESGESIVIQSFGAGADGGDKYSGKAQTNAMKYALLMGFLLSTGDDPEMGDGPAKAVPQRPQAPAPAVPARPVQRGTTEPPPLSDADLAGIDASMPSRPQGAPATPAEALAKTAEEAAAAVAVKRAALVEAEARLTEHDGTPTASVGLSVETFRELCVTNGKMTQAIAGAIDCVPADVKKRVEGMSPVERGVLADELGIDWRTA